MQMRSATLCFLIILVLLGSSTHAENCNTHEITIDACVKPICKLACLASYGKHLREYGCTGSPPVICVCYVCHD
ncbi:hypothetical protein CFC21_020107 [Triticum aestivum]|uniref:Knottin scorpion toxin-like domain-containing protein n=2 Tax=Triticum aestivum TaxID=4565 RepID=A0A9R1J5G7_WHEAT|nr:hypothetical protein CFC21_020107 [Triticum aestivum]